jgi:predicted phosphodiesterase
MGRAKTEYPGIVVCLGGDMISGDIHEELFATNDRTPQQCINDLTDLISAAVERLADHFGKVFLPCVVGNHGRSSRKPRMKGRVFTSHEWNIYCNLERHFRRDPRVQFLIPGDTDAYFMVYGHRFLLTHGDSLGVKGGDGIIGAIGPIMRGSIKVRNSEVEIGKKVDTILMGHWHQTLWLPGPSSTTA